MYFNISSVVEFQKWWVLKGKIDYCQDSTYSEDFFLNSLMIYDSSKSAKIVLSKSIFNVKNQLNFFKKKFSFKNINLGDQFWVKTFFSRLNF